MSSSELATQTMRDVWRLALPLGTRLVAGRIGLVRSVRWVQTSNPTLPLFPELHADEFAILDMRAARTINPHLRLERVVQALADVPVSGLAVNTEVDENAIHAAEKNGVPLFILPVGEDIQRTARAVVRLLIDREIQEETRSAELLRRFTTLIAQEEGLDAVLDALATFTGHLVELDLGGETLRHVPPHLPSTTPPTTWPAYTHHLRDNNGALIATLRLSDPHADHLDRLTRVAAEQAATALSLELSKLRAISAVQHAIHADILDAITAREDPDIIRARARGLGYEIDGVHLVILATTPGTTQWELWARRVRDLAARHTWQALTITRPDHLVILVGTTNATRLVGLNDWLDACRAAWNGPALTLAVSETGHGLEGLREALAQAEDTLALGVRLFGHGQTFRYATMGLYRLFRHLDGNPELFEFYTQTIAPLIAYDHEHHTDLIHTLETVLAHRGNISRAAQALHLHRNSLAYRLQRIKAITGLDPLDPEDAFRFHLALYLRPLVDPHLLHSA